MYLRDMVVKYEPQKTLRSRLYCLPLCINDNDNDTEG